MKYFLKRGEEQYGPYTLAELQQYVRSGNIAMTDLAKSEGMADWAPIPQVIGDVQVPVAAPVGTVYGGPATVQSPLTEQVPLPPNLHWILLLVINLFTRNLFSLIWSLVQANWARKLDNDNSTVILVAMYPAGIVAGIIATIAGGIGNFQWGPGVGGLLIIGGAICSIVGCFKIKAAMEAYYNFNENIGLKLSGVMTFFFGSLYIQYHVNRLARWKNTGVLN